MTDKSVSMGCVIAYGAWAAVAALLAAAWIVGDLRLGQTALAVSAAAATAHIRQFFVCHQKLARAAYEMGREAAAATPIR